MNRLNPIRLLRDKRFVILFAVLFLMIEIFVFQQFFKDEMFLKKGPRIISQDEYPTLIRIYKKTISARPEEIKWEKLILLRDILITNNMHSELIGILNKMVEIHPNDRGLRFYLASELYRQNRYLEAEAQFKILLGEGQDG